MPGDFRQRYRYDHTLPQGDAEQAFAAIDGGGNPVVIKLIAARDPDRFQEEMRTASGIAHPNVARILDWGLDGDRGYVVTQHVEGTRLEALATTGPLAYRAVADAGEQVASALSAIHGRGLVHGGVSPASVIRRSDDTFQLQDLGLRRLSTAPRAADPSSPGAPCISPEEAAGYEPTPASDQYALGAVLYELAAGRPPLPPAPAAATTTAPAAPPPIRSLAPDIPYRLENVISRAMAWRPQERYGSIEEMREELELARRELARPAADTAVTSAMTREEVLPPAPKRSWLWAWILGAILVIAAGLAIAWALGAFGGSVTTPDLAGQSLANATATLANNGLELGDVQYQDDATAEMPGLTVIDQRPAAGTEVDEGSRVDVTLGAETVRVPNVVGLTRAQAETALREAGLTVAPVRSTPSSSVGRGTVMTQDPAGGTVVPPDSQVTLVVSAGTGNVAVPDVVGQDQASAASELQEAGFTVSATQQSSSSVPQGDVISQDPAAGSSAARGSTVGITVSTGPGAVSVPTVVGQSQSQAIDTLEDAGFTVEITEEASDTVSAGHVIRQDPTAGVQAQEGAEVTIFVSTGPEPATSP